MEVFDNCCLRVALLDHKVTNSVTPQKAAQSTRAQRKEPVMGRHGQNQATGHPMSLSRSGHHPSSSLFHFNLVKDQFVTMGAILHLVTGTQLLTPMTRLTIQQALYIIDKWLSTI
jgi:hypothetical protein